MGFFDRFKKKDNHSSQDTPTAKSLPQICYEMAYFMLPQYVFGDPEKLVSYFNNPDISVGAFLYVMFCKAQGIEPMREYVPGFQSHSGELSEGCRYYIVEYPTPQVAIDLTAKDTVLAPYFSAILKTSESNVGTYYILGQRPFGGTTLRTITRDGANANLGEGPLPTLENFLAILRQ